MNIRLLANIYLVLALLLGAMVPIALKVGQQNISIYEFLFLVYLLALPTSLLFVYLSNKQERLKSHLKNARDFLTIALIGLLNYALLEYGLTYAEGFVSASLATAVYRTFPLLMLIFLPVMLRERISAYQIAALLLGFSGLYIAITGGNIFSLGSANAAIVVFLIVIALSGAFATVLVKKYSFDMTASMFIFNLSVFILSILLFLASGTRFALPNSSALIAVLYIGVVYNVFVGFMYYSALRMLKTTFVTNLYFLSPFITFLYASVLLSEPIQPYYIAIAVLVSIGLLIQMFDRRGGGYLAKSKSAQSRFVIHDVTSAFIHTDAPLIYSAIKKGGRVLAVKLDAANITDLEPRIKSNRKNAVQGGALVYTNTDKSFVNVDQDEFIRGIMGVNDNEMVLMSAGDPDMSEKILESITLKGSESDKEI